MVKIFIPVFFLSKFYFDIENIEIEQQSPRNPTQIMPNSCEIIYAGWRREVMGQWRLRRRRRPQRCDSDDEDSGVKGLERRRRGWKFPRRRIHLLQFRLLLRLPSSSPL